MLKDEWNEQIVGLQKDGVVVEGAPVAKRHGGDFYLWESSFFLADGGECVPRRLRLHGGGCCEKKSQGEYVNKSLFHNRTLHSILLYKGN